MKETPPDLSVVTVVLNDNAGLQRAIHSVEQQLGLKIEHIIVDGGSSDGSAQIAALNSSLQIESKPDGGIYAAMHRGALVATGEFLMFCNSGDALLGKRFLAEAIAQLRTSKENWGFGPIVERTQRNTFTWVPADKTASADSIIARRTFVPFPSFIIKRNHYHQIGPLTSNYKIAGDFELICKVAMNSAPVIFSCPVAIFYAGGISYVRADLAWREEIAIRKELLHLGLMQLSRQQFKYFVRFLKWQIGKLLDVFQSVFLSTKRSWRDVRALKVPEIYKDFLPKDV